MIYDMMDLITLLVRYLSIGGMLCTMVFWTLWMLPRYECLRRRYTTARTRRHVWEDITIVTMNCMGVLVMLASIALLTFN